MSKRQRLHLRLDLTSKNLLEEAAACQHKTASEFVLGQALAAAEKVVAAHRQSVRLSDGDWERFCDALIHPPEPNAALLKAAQRYMAQAGRRNRGALARRASGRGPRPRILQLRAARTR